DLDYWKHQLDGVAPLQLPTDRPRRLPRTYEGARERFSLTEHIYRDLLATARREGVTVYMVLLAALSVVLARSSGQRDIAVGGPVANRLRAETERLIGFFVNTVVLRVRVDSERTVRELWAHVRDIARGAYAHQSAPFEKVVEAMPVQRDHGDNPL